mmetsp:Transcript_1567/g.2239  ORF Transcript_1567/g.2239 Transcript_1567/m.2239 type:complete len:284 (-) Transcript_1567:124-975(-)
MLVFPFITRYSSTLFLISSNCREKIVSCCPRCCQHRSHHVKSTTQMSELSLESSSCSEKGYYSHDRDEWKTFSTAELGSGGCYRLGISAVVPRPVAVITSLNKEHGTVNCAPFSYTGLMSHNPPLVSHGICLEAGGKKKKDTLVNIEENKEWVFNVLTDSYLEEANACSEALPPHISEVEKTKLTTLPSKDCKTPRLAQALVSMECRLEYLNEIKNDAGEHTTTIVTGRIVRYHVHSTVLKASNGVGNRSPVVDLQKLGAVGRAGDITYWPAGEGKAVSMKRP